MQAQRKMQVKRNSKSDCNDPSHQDKQMKPTGSNSDGLKKGPESVGHPETGLDIKNDVKGKD